ncbi:MAG: hypothetical protein AABY92_11190 [Thermodesulfobacteriota bacterium]
MMKTATLFAVLAFAIFLIVPGESPSQSSTFAGFKVDALYRAAKVSWKTAGDPKGEMSIQIMRADTFEDGPYQEVGVVKIAPGKSSYEYIDKSMGTEAKYYYKLIIKETNESIGPKPTRPFFSPPAT